MTFLIAIMLFVGLGSAAIIHEKIYIPEKASAIEITDVDATSAIKITDYEKPIKYVEEAVVVWDTTFYLSETSYGRKYVGLTFRYKNLTQKKVTGVKVFISITNSFGKIIYTGTFEDEVVLEPSETQKNSDSWIWEDNRFIDGEPFDYMWKSAKNGTAKIKCKILKVIFEDGTILKAR